MIDEKRFMQFMAALEKAGAEHVSFDDLRKFVDEETKINPMKFTVIDTKTDNYPDLEKIALTEEWAKDLMYCDMERFAISEDGQLLLLDECGNFRYCPDGRFKIEFEEL